MESSIENRDYKFTEMKSYMNKIDSDFTKEKYDIKDINTILTNKWSINSIIHHERRKH